MKAAVLRGGDMVVAEVPEPDLPQWLGSMRRQGYRVVGLEQTDASVNLAEILDDMKLPGILAASAQFALYAYELRLGNFTKFQEMFARHTALKNIEIKKLEGHDPKTRFYVVSAETKRNNLVSARSSTLHAALSYLADKFMQEIITKEFGSGSNAWLNSLLHISSILSNLAFVLNEGFDPSRKLSDETMAFGPPKQFEEKTTLIQ